MLYLFPAAAQKCATNNISFQNPLKTIQDQVLVSEKKISLFLRKLLRSIPRLLGTLAPMLFLLKTTPGPLLDKLPRHANGEAPHALKSEHQEGRGKNVPGLTRDAVKLNAISRDFMNRARCQIHNFKQIDFQLLVRHTTSRCATDGGPG